MESPLVSTDWLAENLNDPNIHIADASWYLPAQNRDGAAEYAEAHIPGAIFWDIDAVADTESGLPHTMPDAVSFERHMEELGIGSDHFIVLYDGMGLFSAARSWWMLRAFGHENCAILDGGFVKWRAEGRAVSADKPKMAPAKFNANYNSAMMHNLEAMLKNLETGDAQILDARASGRFQGTEPEPRPNSRSGHIPGSLNLPYDQLLDPEHKTVLPPDALTRKFADAGIDLSRPVVTSCGSGVTACILALGFLLSGKTDISVYDGSWSEWGTHPDTPVETG